MAAKKKQPPRVVRRGPDERKKLPPELEEFARSDEKRFRPPRKHRPRLKDPRPSAVIPGVRNLDARDVHDVRARRMHEALDSLAAGGAEGKAARPVVDRLLAEAWLLRHHRGRSFVDFEAFVESDLDLRAEDAMLHVGAGLEALGLEREPLTEETIAAFVRAEAALLPRDEGPRLQATISVFRDEDGVERIRIEAEASRAAPALHAIGQKMSQLAEDQGARVRPQGRGPGGPPRGRGDGPPRGRGDGPPRGRGDGPPRGRGDGPPRGKGGRGPKDR